MINAGKDLSPENIHDDWFKCALYDWLMGGDYSQGGWITVEILSGNGYTGGADCDLRVSVSSAFFPLKNEYPTFSGQYKENGRIHSET